jgi:hypothetical protein
VRGFSGCFDWPGSAKLARVRLLEDRLCQSAPGNLSVWRGARPRADGGGRGKQTGRPVARVASRFAQAPGAACPDAITRRTANLAVAMWRLRGRNPEDLRPLRCSAAALVRAVNRRRLCLSDLRIRGGFPCPTLVVDLREGRPSPTSRTPDLSKPGLILASHATLRDHRDGHTRSFCTRQRRRGRFPHSNICSQLGPGRRCDWMAMRPTITQQRPEAAVRTHGKHMLEPVSRWLDRSELLAGGDCGLVTWHASVGDPLRKRDCERGVGHGCCKHPI